MGIKDYLSNKTEKEKMESLKKEPALLFVNNKAGGFGHIYLFEKFGSETVNSIKLSSQITTHYMENNTARQDHWAIAPVSYTVSGLIGEIVYTPPKRLTTYIQERTNFIDYLAPLAALAPTFDNYTQSAINVVQGVEASIRRYGQIAREIFADVTNAPTKDSNQQQILQMLASLRDNRQLVSVYTPFGTYESLAIQDVSMTQNNSKYQSELEIQFIEWRNTKTKYREATKEDFAILAQCQKAPDVEQGNASTQEEDISTLLYLKRKGINPLIKAFGG